MDVQNVVKLSFLSQCPDPYFETLRVSTRLNPPTQGRILAQKHSSSQIRDKNKLIQTLVKSIHLAPPALLKSKARSRSNPPFASASPPPVVRPRGHFSTTVLVPLVINCVSGRLRSDGVCRSPGSFGQRTCSCKLQSVLHMPPSPKLQGHR